MPHTIQNQFGFKAFIRLNAKTFRNSCMFTQYNIQTDEFVGVPARNTVLVNLDLILSYLDIAHKYV